MNQSQFQKAAGISAGLAARWFPHIDAAMKEYGITAPLDQAMFIAQMGHESTRFTRLVENLNYAVENLGYRRSAATASLNSNPPHLAERQRNRQTRKRSPIWYTVVSGEKNTLAIRSLVMAGNIAVVG